jgi:hypothetical protein
MNKQPMMTLLNSMLAVVLGEDALLDTWSQDPGLGPGQLAIIRLARRAIMNQPTSPAFRADSAKREGDAKTDAQVLRRPSDDHLSAAGIVRNSLATRETWNVSTMSASFFEDAVFMSQQNADQAASLAQAILKDCT